MAYTYAGRYGAQQILNSAGAPQPSKAVSVFLTGTQTFATLYTDRTKSLASANPVNTDSLGNLTFFADPGTYDLQVAGIATVETVQVTFDVNEPAPAPFGSVHTGASSAVHGISGSVVGTTDTQTLTNKTLTSPTVNGVAVTNTPVQSKSGLAANRPGSVYPATSPSAGIAGLRYLSTDDDREFLDDGTTWHQILTKTSADAAYVRGANAARTDLTAGDGQTTTSASYTDLTTVGPDVPVTVPASGNVLVTMSGDLTGSLAGSQVIMSYEIVRTDTSAVLVAADDRHAIKNAGTDGRTIGNAWLETGLPAGVPIRARAKYKVSGAGGTGTYYSRRLAVVPL